MDEIRLEILRAIDTIRGPDSIYGASDVQLAESLGSDLLTIRDHLRLMEMEGLVKLVGDRSGIAVWLEPQGRMALDKSSETQSTKQSWLDVLELKPNLYGIGLDLKKLFRRFRK